jgi:hypothetical protein
MLEQQLRRAYELTGEVTTLWSQAESIWYLIFTCLMPETEPSKVDAIFGQFQTGRAQRELIIAVAKAALDSEPKIYRKDPKARFRKRLLNRIGQLHDQTARLSNRRNEAAHAAFEVSYSVIPPRILATGVYKASTLQGKDIIPELEDSVDEVSLLVLDLLDLRGDFLDFEHGGEDPPQPIRQRLGRQPARDERKAERARILQAAVLRKQLRHQP